MALVRDLLADQRAWEDDGLNFSDFLLRALSTDSQVADVRVLNNDCLRRRPSPSSLDTCVY
jgi:hypothetical protein